MTIGDFLRAPLPVWDWVNHDCSRWVDRWVQSRGRGSPIAALGLVYDSERSALRRIAEGRGLLPLWTAGMALVGAPEPDEPAAGDVGVIPRATVCGTHEAMALFTGDRWVTLDLRGYQFGPAVPLRVWRP